MNQPTVCAIMLTKDRPHLARKAVECFRVQTYQNKKLLIGISGEDRFRPGLESGEAMIEACGESVGDLRNYVNGCVTQGDIIIHWDDDDWSHPNRITEQVAMLQSSGAECVGYNEMLFWREPAPSECTSDPAPPDLPFFGAETPLCSDAKCNRRGPHYPREYGCRWGKDPVASPGEAWLYSQPNPRAALGTSLCYWREVWEKRPFPALQNGEDTAWLQEVRCVSHSSFIGGLHDPDELTNYANGLGKPRMIARIHPGNTGNIAYRPDVMAAIERQGGEWKRVPQWDAVCRSTME